MITERIKIRKDHIILLEFNKILIKMQIILKNLTVKHKLMALRVEIVSIIEK